MALPAILIGGAVGFVGGYIADQIIGDGEYSVGEAFFDAAGGAMGGAVLKPIGIMGGRALSVGRAHVDDGVKFAIRTVDDAVGAIAGVTSGQMKPIGIGVTTGILGDAYTRMRLSESSGSRSERNGPNVGPGDTAFKVGLAYAGSRIAGEIGNRMIGKSYRTTRFGICREGYVKRKVKGRWMCIRQ